MGLAPLEVMGAQLLLPLQGYRCSDLQISLSMGISIHWGSGNGAPVDNVGHLYTSTKCRK